MWDKLDREYSEQIREENLDAMQQMYDEEVESGRMESKQPL